MVKHLVQLSNRSLYALFSLLQWLVAGPFVSLTSKTHSSMAFWMNLYLCVQQPPGFIHPQMLSHVCRLHEALYNLKQALRAWFACLSSRLNELGFLPSKSDSSLIILRTPHLMCFVLLYMDDIIVTCSNSSAITSFISQLGTKFAVKDLRPLNFFLGVKVLFVSGGLLLSQHRYITDLLCKVHMVDAKPVTSPMSSAHTLSQFVGDAFDAPTFYRSTVGAFQNLAITRPDISFVVNKVCQFMHRPTIPHWTAVKCILRYLKNTIHHGLLLHRSSSLSLHAYSDADWASCQDH